MANRIEEALDFIDSYLVTTVAPDGVEIHHIDDTEWQSVKARVRRMFESKPLPDFVGDEVAVTQSEEPDESGLLTKAKMISILGRGAEVTPERAANLLCKAQRDLTASIVRAEERERIIGLIRTKDFFTTYVGDYKVQLILALKQMPDEVKKEKVDEE